MTHLKIQQNNIPETVTTALLDKLYGIVSANDYVYHSDDLQGTLQVDKAYEDTIAYLQQRFPDLHITATTQYIRFADPEVQRILAANWGDGVGVTLQDTQSKTSISSLFKQNTTITSFDELGRMTTITSIEDQAFDRCSNLTSIDLSNIQNIGGSSFRNTKLTGVINLPNIKAIGTNSVGIAFSGCSYITEVHLGQYFERFLKEDHFKNCTRLTTVTGLSGLSSITFGVFDGCSALTSVDLNMDGIALPANLFSGCSNLDITIPSTLDINDHRVFQDCSSLTFPQTLTISPSTFDGVGFRSLKGTKVNNVVLSQSVVKLYNECFSGCTQLQTVSGLDHITHIGQEMFNGCTNLVGNNGVIDLRSTVGFVSGSVSGSAQGGQYNMFTGCNNITKIIFGSLPYLESNSTVGNRKPIRQCNLLETIDVTGDLGYIRLGSNAGGTVNALFSDVPKLTSLILRSNTLVPLQKSTANNTTITINRLFPTTGTGRIYVPADLVNSYKAATNWSDIADYIYPVSQFEIDHPNG